MLINNNSKPNKFNVKVIPKKIEDSANYSWNPETDTSAAHIFYSHEDEVCLNKLLYSVYNKSYKWYKANINLLKDNGFLFVHLLIKSHIFSYPC